MDLVQKVWDSREQALLAGLASSALREVPGHGWLCAATPTMPVMDHPLELHASTQIRAFFHKSFLNHGVHSNRTLSD